MKRVNWVRLDTASKIFLATLTDKDPKVFRVSAALVDSVDPQCLQEALDEAYDHFLLYHSVLRRGFFWYYMEETDLRPVVELDTKPPCAPIYHFDSKNLLFRVVYNGCWVHLEVFHALSDGTGALWFLENLLYRYVLLRYESEMSGRESTFREQGSINQSLDDSFARYFKPKGHWRLTDKAQTAVKTVVGASRAVGKAATRLGNGAKKRKIYQVKGIRTPDSRQRFVEAVMPASRVIALAKANQTTLTVYLIALFIEAVYRDMPENRKDRTIALSVPVNLRQYFDSQSARNFFATITVSYTYGENGEDGDSIGTICQSLSAQFKEKINRETLEKKQQQLVSYELHPLLRLFFRPVKDLVLRVVNFFNNKTLTLAISNLGRVHYREEMSDYIDYLTVVTSAVRPQFCSISYGDELSIGFSSPFIETEIQKNMVRLLTQEGIPVTVAANKVNIDVGDWRDREEVDHEVL